MGDEAVKAYLHAVEQEHRTGKAREHAYRPALKALVEALGGGEVQAVNEPARVECGAPDFIVERKDRGIPLGYIEAKDIDENLDHVERSDQLSRYLGALDNLVLTDYLEFRRYSGGELRQSLRTARFDARGKLKPEPEAEAKLADFIGTFLSVRGLRIGTSQLLIGRLARLARMMQEAINSALKQDACERQDSMLCHHLQEVREELIKDLPAERFADM